MFNDSQVLRPYRAWTQLFPERGDGGRQRGQGGQRIIINMLIILKVDDAILMAEVMAAGEGQLEALVERLRQQGVHSTHYIMVRLGLR